MVFYWQVVFMFQFLRCLNEKSFSREIKHVVAIAGKLYVDRNIQRQFEMDFVAVLVFTGAVLLLLYTLCICEQ